MAEQVFDVLIVGAGPGGSNAAAVCLSRGLSVAQIDAKEFPRVKPCAGGLTPKSIAALQYGIEACRQNQSGRLSFGLWKSTGHDFQHPVPILQFVHRPQFDDWLVRRNLEYSGFRFFPGEPALSIEYRHCFELETPQRTLRGRQLIGADGGYSITNRIFEISRPRGRATAIEVEVPRDGATRTVGDPRFDFGVADQGYGWVFPKRDYWSIGVYTLSEKPKGLRKALRRYLEDLGFEAAGDFQIRGHRYPVGGYTIQAPECPLYLVGDAGGFAEAVTGEGIYHALESGRLAGLSAAEFVEGKGSTDWFYRRLRRRVLWDSFLSWKFAQTFYRHPAGWLRVFGNPLAWRTVLEGYAEGANLAECVFWSGLYFLKSWRKGVRRE